MPLHKDPQGRWYWVSLDAELMELERTDPAVRKAREHYDEVTSEFQRWRRQMVRDIWPE